MDLIEARKLVRDIKKGMMPYVDVHSIDMVSVRRYGKKKVK